MNVKGFYKNYDNHNYWKRIITLGSKNEITFTRYKNPIPPNFTSNVGDILSVQWPGRHIYSQEEEFYFLNHIKNFKHAKKLDKAQDHREALLALHLSVEMLLKHLISKTIHFNQQRYGQPATSELLEVFGSHDIPSISKSLMLVLNDFRTPSLLAIHSELNLMKNRLGKWAQIRYSNPYSTTKNRQCQIVLTKLWPEVIAFRKDLRSKGVVRWT